MRSLRFLKAVLLLGSLLAVTEIGAATQGSTPKSFAIFSVSYNANGESARGGVCGTAFFIGRNLAVTAYHVANRGSFRPQPGFTETRLWLVHENETPIELKPSDMIEDPSHDVTQLRLGEKVAAHFVYDVGVAEKFDEVTSEGFVASSVGPVLKRVGQKIEIVSVPRLERLSTHGQIQNRVRIDMNATDVKLKNSPGVQLSYKPVLGLSGGPVLARGKVIAMNSFADPRNFKTTWALDLNSYVPVKN